MTFEELKRMAKRRHCAVRYGEIQNGNNPFHGHVALFVRCHDNGRGTHFVGFNNMHSTALYHEAADWIRRNAKEK